jgi:hypothetical protein
MRTTVDIPDAVFRRAKAVAALEGKSLKTFVLEALTRELRNRANPKAGPKRVKLPLISSQRPGSLHITGDTIADALNAEDLHALAGH